MNDSALMHLAGQMATLNAKLDEHIPIDNLGFVDIPTVSNLMGFDHKKIIEACKATEIDFIKPTRGRSGRIKKTDVHRIQEYLLAAYSE